MPYIIYTFSITDSKYFTHSSVDTIVQGMQVSIVVCETDSEAYNKNGSIQ